MLSSHVTICISGFLSQKSDEYNSWKHLIYDIEHTNLSLYDYRWESMFSENVSDAVKKVAASTLTSSFFSFRGFLAGLSGIFAWFIPVATLFIGAYSQTTRLFK